MLVSYVKKNKIFLNRIYRDIRILFKHIQRTGCSKKELYGEEYDAMKDLSDAVDEHATPLPFLARCMTPSSSLLTLLAAPNPFSPPLRAPPRQLR